MVGKRVRDSTYVHVSARDWLEPEQLKLLHRVERLACDFVWNVARIGRSDVTLLDYPTFDEDPFPALRASLKIEPASGKFATRSFASAANPPILHRKELLLSPGDERAQPWAELTRALVDAGVFADNHRIGHRSQWRCRLEMLGLFVREHRLCRS
ncbi:MAG: hypothetical protein QOI38_2722 [Sphingomonadales bacterium]|jgi:hypothetical protein|nr:hypothetical protein [Sphingomonadales bacterium]